MNQNNLKQTEYFYKSLRVILKISEFKYDYYLKTRTFETALALLFNNLKILRLLIGNIKYSKDSDIKDFQNLISHYNSWVSDFESHVFQQRPKFDSLFIFKRSKESFPYPKDFIEKLLARECEKKLKKI